MNSKALFVGLAALSLSVSAPAEEPVFTAGAFRAHVAFLADDLLEGREAGTRGYDIAARYVAAQFEALGLQPAAGGRWFQDIRFVRSSFAGTPRLTIGGRAFDQGGDIVIRASADTAALSLEAPAVFVGYGIDAPGLGFDDYADLDVRGKVVVVLSGYPAGTASDVGAHLNSEKPRMAAARGAVGMITVRTPRDRETFAWRTLAGLAARPATSWIGADGRPYSTDGLRFGAIAEGEAAAALFQGARRSLDRIMRDAGRQGVRPRGFTLRPTVRAEREEGNQSRFDSANVLAVLPGTDPALANEYVLLMAHLDGLGVRERQEGDAEDADLIRNGAMDNATGVSTLIEVARAMSDPANRPRRPILIAAVTAEEIGLIGANYLVHHPVVEGRIVGVVNLDMPVLTYDFSDVIAFGAEHSTMGETVTRAAARMQVGVIPDPMPEQGIFTRSDHYRFVQAGVPSVFLMTGFGGEGRERFTNFLSTQYHSVNDDLSLPFNWDAGARFVRLNYLIAREIADSPAPPRWNADSPFAPAAQ
jgi:hypothetical protein